MHLSHGARPDRAAPRASAFPRHRAVDHLGALEARDREVDGHERRSHGRQREGSRDHRVDRVLVPRKGTRKGPGEVRRPSGILRDGTQAHRAHRVVRVGRVRLRRGSQAQGRQLAHHQSRHGDWLRLASPAHGNPDPEQRQGTFRHHARPRPGEVPELGALPGEHARRRRQGGGRRAGHAAARGAQAPHAPPHEGGRGEDTGQGGDRRLGRAHPGAARVLPHDLREAGARADGGEQEQERAAASKPVHGTSEGLQPPVFVRRDGGGFRKQEEARRRARRGEGCEGSGREGTRTPGPTGAPTAAGHDHAVQR